MRSSTLTASAGGMNAGRARAPSPLPGRAEGTEKTALPPVGGWGFSPRRTPSLPWGSAGVAMMAELAHQRAALVVEVFGIAAGQIVPAPILEVVRQLPVPRLEKGPGEEAAIRHDRILETLQTQRSYACARACALGETQVRCRLTL